MSDDLQPCEVKQIRMSKLYWYQGAFSLFTKNGMRTLFEDDNCSLFHGSIWHVVNIQSAHHVTVWSSARSEVTKRLTAAEPSAGRMVASFHSVIFTGISHIAAVDVRNKPVEQVIPGHATSGGSDVIVGSPPGTRAHSIQWPHLISYHMSALQTVTRCLNNTTTAHTWNYTYLGNVRMFNADM